MAGGGSGAAEPKPLPIDMTKQVARNSIDSAERNQFAWAAQDLLDPHREGLAIVERLGDPRLVSCGPVGRAMKAGLVFMGKAQTAETPRLVEDRECDSRCISDRPVRILDSPVPLFELIPLLAKVFTEPLLELFVSFPFFRSCS